MEAAGPNGALGVKNKKGLLFKKPLMYHSAESAVF
jgi:hypothetical protein